MENSKPGYYAVIPASVRYDDKIPANAKLLYGEISALVGDEGFCYASNQYFMDLYGFSMPTITRLLSSLENAGYITRQLIKDESGKVVHRKLYLTVSLPGIHPLINFDTTPHQKKGEGPIKNDEYTNLSNTNIEKENKKEKARGRRAPMTDEQLLKLCVDWISKTAGPDWPREIKNGLYYALAGFYAPRAEKKQEPSRTEAAFTALTNRLIRYSGKDPEKMVDILERATTAGWKSVYPPLGMQTPQPREEEGVDHL